MKQLKTKNGKLLGGIIAFCLATMVLIWMDYFQQIRSDKEETIASAIQRNSNLAVALEQYAVRTIHNADAILQLVKMEFSTKGRNINIDELLYSEVVNKDIFKGVAVINEKG